MDKMRANAYKLRNTKQICGKRGWSQGLVCAIVYVAQSTYSVKNTEYRMWFWKNEKIEHKTPDISENSYRKLCVQMHGKREGTDCIFTKHRNMV